MNSLQKNNPGTPPDHTPHDPLARMQARLSSCIAPRRDGLADPPTPDDPAGRFASRFRQQGGLDVDYPELSGLDEASYRSIFVACDSTAHDTA